ncbi:VOC family protein [Frondihabitans cladoniiphilus]|uniref:VOC family protein n=1 Tax=Frondihabitans cladoniiphilus TaxID=715785 RepID=A0ABP8W824_9MICO
MIESIASVVIPVNDHESAVAFYRDVLGFTVQSDFTPAPGMRWVELTLPGTATVIALATPRGGMWRGVGGDTNISLACSGIVDEHQRLLDAGADVDEQVLVLGEYVPRMFRLRDPDGNILQLVEAK